MNSCTLVASINGREVGHLVAEEDWAFEYSEAWPGFENANALSPHFPLHWRGNHGACGRSCMA